MSGGESGVSHLVHNERTKLLALALNTASTSAFTVGVLAPVAAAFYNFSLPGLPLHFLVVGAALWILLAVVLHLLARRLLGELRE